MAATVVKVLEQDAIDYIQAHPEVIGKAVALVPKRDKCLAAIGLASAGFALAVGAATGAIPVTSGVLGGVIATSGSALVTQFCGGSSSVTAVVTNTPK